MVSIFSVWFFSLLFFRASYFGLSFGFSPTSSPSSPPRMSWLFSAVKVKKRWQVEEKKKKKSGIFNLLQKSPCYWQSNYFGKGWLANSFFPSTNIHAQAHILPSSFLCINGNLFVLFCFTFSWHKSFTFLMQPCSKFCLSLGHVLFLSII